MNTPAFVLIIFLVALLVWCGARILQTMSNTVSRVKVLAVTLGGAPSGRTRIDVVLTTGLFRSYFHNVVFEGSSTVWHNVETGGRPESWIERCLSNAEWKAQRQADLAKQRERDYAR